MEQNSEYIECPLSQATIIKIGKHMYPKNDCFVINGECLSVRLEYDRWQDLCIRDLDLFGVIPLREKLMADSYETKTIIHPRGDHAVAIIELPPDYNYYIGYAVKCTLKFKEEN